MLIAFKESILHAKTVFEGISQTLLIFIDCEEEESTGTSGLNEVHVQTLIAKQKMENVMHQ